jgi:Flp pilus assembly protein protease CpaA
MFILTAIMLILGLVTSYTDIRFKKIRNIHLLAAAILGLAAYIFLITTRQMTFHISLIENLFIGLGIGLLLYFTDTWGAGDAKLFTVLCLLMPTGKYSAILFFPSIAVFVNIFLISTFAILILSIKDIIKNKERLFKKIFSVRTFARMGESFLMLFSLQWLIQTGLDYLLPEAAPFFSIVLLFLAYRTVRWMMKKLRNDVILFLILGLALALRLLLHPEAFDFLNLLRHIKTTVLYTLIFDSISLIFNMNKPDPKTPTIMPFAPLMLLGALAANTNFLHWVIHLLKAIGK